MEISKMQTLRLMLDQEKKNLENLKSPNNVNRNEVMRAETNISKLTDQLRQMCGEVRFLFFNYFLPSFVLFPPLLSYIHIFRLFREERTEKSIFFAGIRSIKIASEMLRQPLYVVYMDRF